MGVKRLLFVGQVLGIFHARLDFSFEFVALVYCLLITFLFDLLSTHNSNFIMPLSSTSHSLSATTSHSCSSSSIFSHTDLDNDIISKHFVSFCQYDKNSTPVTDDIIHVLKNDCSPIDNTIHNLCCHIHYLNIFK